MLDQTFYALQGAIKVKFPNDIKQSPRASIRCLAVFKPYIEYFHSVGSQLTIQNKSQTYTLANIVKNQLLRT